MRRKNIKKIKNECGAEKERAKYIFYIYLDWIRGRRIRGKTTNVV